MLFFNTCYCENSYQLGIIQLIFYPLIALYSEKQFCFLFLFLQRLFAKVEKMVTGGIHGTVIVTSHALLAIRLIDHVRPRLHWITTLTITCVNIHMIISVKILVSKNIFVENFVATISRTHPCSIYYFTTITSEYIWINRRTWVRNV